MGGIARHVYCVPLLGRNAVAHRAPTAKIHFTLLGCPFIGREVAGDRSGRVGGPGSRDVDGGQCREHYLKVSTNGNLHTHRHPP